MATIQEFLANNPSINRVEPDKSSDAISVSVIILHIGNERMEFGHFGIAFSVSREDVLDICECDTPLRNPFGRGRAATIKLKSNCNAYLSLTIQADELIKDLPFAMVTLTKKSKPATPSDREVRWKSLVGYQYNPSNDSRDSISTESLHETLSYADNPPVPCDTITDQGFY